MHLIDLVLKFTAIGLMMCLGFAFLYESMGEESFVPEDLALPGAATGPLGLVLTVGSTLLLVWQLILLH